MTIDTQYRIVVFPLGQISEYDKARMAEFGILAVEADDPHAVVQLAPTAPLVCTGITGDAIVRAALSAIASQRPENGSGFITEAGRAAHTFIAALSKSLEPSNDQ